MDINRDPLAKSLDSEPRNPSKKKKMTTASVWPGDSSQYTAIDDLLASRLAYVQGVYAGDSAMLDQINANYATRPTSNADRIAFLLHAGATSTSASDLADDILVSTGDYSAFV